MTVSVCSFVGKWTCNHTFQPTSHTSSLRILFFSKTLISVCITPPWISPCLPFFLPVCLCQSVHLCKLYVMEEGSCEKRGDGSRHAPAESHPPFPFDLCWILFLFLLLPFSSTFLPPPLLYLSTWFPPRPVCFSDSSLALSHWLLESKTPSFNGNYEISTMRSRGFLNSSLRLRTPRWSCVDCLL